MGAKNIITNCSLPQHALLETDHCKNLPKYDGLFFIYGGGNLNSYQFGLKKNVIFINFVEVKRC